MDFVQKIDADINYILESYVKKPTVIRGVIHLILILYAARLAPTLPAPVLGLFENQYFKLFIFSMILWTAQFSPATSILIALGFMITVNLANKKAYWEFMENVSESKASEQGVTVAITPVKAVDILAEAAVSTKAANPTLVADVATVAKSAVQTKEGSDAIKTLASQATTAEATSKEKVSKVADIAVMSMPTTVIKDSIKIDSMAPAPAPAPEMAPVPAPEVKDIKEESKPKEHCFPRRQVDISKITGLTEMSSLFEDYQEFKL